MCIKAIETEWKVEKYEKDNHFKAVFAKMKDEKYKKKKKKKYCIKRKS